MSDKEPAGRVQLIREWATPAALLGVIALLAGINKNIDSNCDAISATNAQIRFTLAVSAENTADKRQRAGLRRQVENFPEPDC